MEATLNMTWEGLQAFLAAASAGNLQAGVNSILEPAGLKDSLLMIVITMQQH